jgi:hypothetical protein
MWWRGFWLNSWYLIEVKIIYWEEACMYHMHRYIDRSAYIYSHSNLKRFHDYLLPTMTTVISISISCEKKSLKPVCILLCKLIYIYIYIFYFIANFLSMGKIIGMDENYFILADLKAYKKVIFMHIQYCWMETV